MDTISQLNTALAGRYEVEQEIGAGGMATVFLARDLKHDRHVALKLLKPELGAVLGVDRFLSEIKVTANLQHPNLLPLFDSGAADGLLFYVMPYVEGESLRARLDRENQLPVDDAIRISVAVASALDYAHRHGVIHRDLKPENILLHEGQPLVADFGIALAVSNAGGTRVTQTGLSLGTPQYMSPEQATGDRVIDGRSDIYSLAAVTYEMLTGEAPHTGSSAQAIIARVLTEKPRSVRATRPSVPEHVQAVLERALEKLAADRWATAGQFADALQGRGGAFVTRAGAATARSRSLTPMALCVGIAVTCAIAAIVAWLKLSRIEPSLPVRFTLNVPDDQKVMINPGMSIAISHDGRTIAYIGTGPQSQMVYVRKMGTLQTTGIPMIEPAADLKFSPDDRWISFVRPQGSIVRVPVEGGPFQVIARPAAVPEGTNWSAVGPLVYASGGAIWRVDAPGSTPSAVVRIDTTRHQLDAAGPWVFPNGKDVMFGVLEPDGVHATVASIDGGNIAISDKTASGSNVLGYVDGWMIFGREDGTINALRYDQRARDTQGSSVSLVDGVLYKLQGGVEASLSDNGTLAYLGGEFSASLVIVDSHGIVVSKTAVQGEYSNPAWSPDGKKIAIERRGTASELGSIWIYDIASKALSRLRTHASVTRPAWMSDSRHVAYESVEGNASAIWSAPADASGPEALLFALPENMPADVTFSLDGKFAVIRTDNASPTKGDLYVVALQGAGERKPVPIVKTPFQEGTPSVSPNGRWLAYASDETGRLEIYLQPFPGGGGRVQVSTEGGAEPRWSPDGAHVVYRGPRAFWSATVSTATATPVITHRDSLFADDFRRTDVYHQGYDIGRDGRFAMLRSVSEKTELIVVTNWWTEARAKLKVK